MQPSASQELPVTLTLRSSAGDDVNYPMQTTDAGGFFTVTVTGYTGPFSWRAKSAQPLPLPADNSPGFLASSGTLVLEGAQVTDAELGLQKSGDCNNDNVVNIFDFSIMRATFGKSSGLTGYDNRADITGDGSVGVADFVQLKNNFGIGGAPPLVPVILPAFR